LQPLDSRWTAVLRSNAKNRVKIHHDIDIMMTLTPTTNARTKKKEEDTFNNLQPSNF
jgi:hypothetical protein